MIQTAGGVNTNNVNRIEYGDFPDNNGNWTILIRYKLPSTPSGYFVLFDLFDGDADYSDPYLYLGNGSGTTDVTLECNVGGVQDTANFTAVVGTQYWAGVTYDSTTHALTYINNGTTIGSITANLSAIDWDKFYLLGDDSGNTTNPACVAYCRAWNRKLTTPQLTSEAASITVVDDTDLLWDSPLQTGIDLTDHNLGLNTFIPIGTVTTDFDDPLLSTIAGPPTNTTANDALAIDTDSAIFQDIITSGNFTTVWYKYTIQMTDNCLSFQAFGADDSSSLNYRPILSVFRSLADALALTDRVIPTSFVTTEFSALFGTTYYFQVLRNRTSGNAVDGVQVSLLKVPQIAVETGDIVHTDSSANFLPDEVAYPTFVVDPVSGLVKNSVNPFVESIRGTSAVITSGEICIYNDVTNAVEIYDNTFSLIATPAVPTNGSLGYCVGTDGTTGFWVVKRNVGVESVAYFILPDGTVDQGPYTLTGTAAVQVNKISPNIANTKLYYANATGIAQITIPGLVASQFITLGAGSFRSTVLITLANDSICVSFINTGGGGAITASEVRNYNSAGTLVRTWDLFPEDAFTEGLFLATNNSTSFWGWTTDLLTSPNGWQIRYWNFVTADPTIPTPLVSVAFVEGDGQQGLTSSPYSRTGTNSGGAVWVQLGTMPPVGGNSGLYTVSGTGAGSGNPLIRHDQNWIDVEAGDFENVKIPNPYYDTYLAGDE